MAKNPKPPRQTVPNNPGAEMRIALALSIIWLLACVLYLTGVPNAKEQSMASVINMIFTFVGIFFPLVLIWTIAYVASSIRGVRSESAILRDTLEQIKEVLANKPGPDQDRERRIQLQLDEIAALSLQTDNRLTELAEKTFAKTGDVPPARKTAALAQKKPGNGDNNQTYLPLHSPAGPERVPITIQEFIKALNFPDNPEDKEGFRVLRRAFEERELGKLLQASQDALTLLSQDGIYMDDLNPDLPLPSVWRKFARGERGLVVSALGGIRDRSALTLAKTRLKNDPIFRDATHHFLRNFDQILMEFEKTAEDNELLEMSQTRSARAFMLLGRVSGSFD